ncbi:MAG: PorV/PorQ family protein [Elusimicrobia bacterium]|nr:PorV/PorQ family protein [Elusimicrobiota bacterium]
MKSFRIAAVIIAVISSLAYAKGTGSTAAQFLAIGPGARASGMGETGVADVIDGYALYWNPANLGRLQKTVVDFTHMEYVQDIKYDYMAYAEPTAYGTFSAGALSLYTGDIAKTTEDIAGNYQATGQTFGSMEYAVLFGWGKQIGRKLALGFSAKSINQTIDVVSASGFAGDVGASYFFTDMFRMGMAVQNMGGQIKGNDLPSNVKLGCSIVLPKQFMSIAVDADYPPSGKPSFGVGMENRIAKGMVIRDGFNTRPETGGISGIHLGLGITWQQMKFDYAFGMYGDIGGSHMLSMGYAFKTGLGGRPLSGIAVYPNPVDFSTEETGTLHFKHIPKDAVIRIFDMSGKLVKSIRPGTAGNDGVSHKATWDGKNDNDVNVGVGEYFYLISDINGHQKSGKMIVTGERTKELIREDNGSKKSPIRKNNKKSKHTS